MLTYVRHGRSFEGFRLSLQVCIVEDLIDVVYCFLMFIDTLVGQKSAILYVAL